MFLSFVSQNHPAFRWVFFFRQKASGEGLLSERPTEAADVLPLGVGASWGRCRSQNEKGKAVFGEVIFFWFYFFLGGDSLYLFPFSQKPKFFEGTLLCNPFFKPKEEGEEEKADFLFGLAIVVAKNMMLFVCFGCERDL